jgi:cyclase
MGSMGRVPDPIVRRVADGVYAYLQPDGSWFLNNSGFIVGDDAVVLVDQCGTEDRSRAFLAAVSGETNRPVRTLVNTHHHADHTFGNYLVPVGTSIVGHHRAREEQIETGTGIAALFEGPDWGDLIVRPPDVTFEDRLVVWVDERRLDLIHFGRAAHTTNDVVVWMEDTGLAFTGDLIFNTGTPFALQGSVAGWLESLRDLERLGAATLVPGHGPVCGPEAIAPVRSYLEWVEELAVDGIAAGLTPLEAAQRAGLGPYAGLSDPERLVGNLHRSYAERNGLAQGAPLDLAPVIADMVTYNGGPIQSHA